MFILSSIQADIFVTIFYQMYKNIMLTQYFKGVQWGKQCDSKKNVEYMSEQIIDVADDKT